MSRRGDRRAARSTGAVVVVLLVGVGTGCAGSTTTTPRCEPDQRLGIMAQAVPTASYLPCVHDLATGWRFGGFGVDDDGARFTLVSDRAADPVDVTLDESCDTSGAVPVAPRAEGVRTSQRLTGISPSYRGALFDEFPGGCVTYRFRFERGPHIALMDELQQTIGLYPRRQLRRELRDWLGVDVDP